MRTKNKLYRNNLLNLLVDVRFILPVFFLIFSVNFCFTQTGDFTLAGIESNVLFESQPDLPDYQLSGTQTMSAYEISAFTNFAYRLSPKTLAFHSLKWGQKDYSFDVNGRDEQIVPPYFQSLPTMNCLDFSSAILHDFSNDWGLTGMARISLTNGNGAYNLENDFNYIGLVLVKRKWSKKEFGLGGFYYRGTAKNVYLPLFSININQNKWLFKGTLPLTFLVKYEVHPKVFLGLNHEVGSSGYTFQSTGTTQGNWSEVSTVELVKWMIGPTVSWRMTKNFELVGKTGFYNYDFTFGMQEGGEESLMFKNNVFASLGLNYVISVDK